MYTLLSTWICELNHSAKFLSKPSIGLRASTMCALNNMSILIHLLPPR